VRVVLGMPFFDHMMITLGSGSFPRVAGENADAALMLVLTRVACAGVDLRFCHGSFAQALAGGLGSTGMQQSGWDRPIVVLQRCVSIDAALRRGSGGGWEGDGHRRLPWGGPADRIIYAPPFPPLRAVWIVQARSSSAGRRLWLGGEGGAHG